MRVFRTDTDKFIAYLKGEDVKFTKTEEEKIQRLIRCNKLITLHQVKSEVIEIIKNSERVKYQTALQIYQQAEQVFGEISISAKKFKLNLVWENMLANRKACWKLGEHKTVQKIDKDMGDLAGKYYIEETTIPYHELQPPPILMSSDPTLIEGVDAEEEKEIRKKAQKILQRALDKTTDAIAEEVDYEELNEEVNQLNKKSYKKLDKK